jgi:hypothetical protein
MLPGHTVPAASVFSFQHLSACHDAAFRLRNMSDVGIRLAAR